MTLSSASSRRRFVASARTMTVYCVVSAILFLASSSAATPLYRLYQEQMGLTPFIVTLIFGAYTFSLLLTLLTVGGLSDYVGRKPVICVALIFNALAMLAFVLAQSASGLVLARLLQGVAVGVATTTLGAAILDTDPVRGPFFNSITSFIGLMLGAVGAGALVTLAPARADLVFEILLVSTVVGLVLLAQMPETSIRRPGALASLRPRVRVPPQARGPLMRVTPVNIAAWALGGFYFSLMPSLVKDATGISSAFVGGGVVGVLMLVAATMVVVTRTWPAGRTLLLGGNALALGVIITLIGVYAQHLLLLTLGTAISGIGFGAGFAGVMKTILPLADADERAALLSTFYVVSYLAFSVLAIAAGLGATYFGLIPVAYAYGALVIVLTLISLAALRQRAPAIA